MHPISSSPIPSHFSSLFPLHLHVPSVSTMTSSSSSHTSEMPSEALTSGAFSPPQNSYEWKKALLKVKWLCFNQQYKQCALRCNQLIDTASSPVRVPQISCQTLVVNRFTHSSIRSAQPTSNITQPPHMSIWDEQLIYSRL